MQKLSASFVFFGLLILLSCGTSEAKERDGLTWIFLNTGSNKTPLHKAEADKMLQAHLANFMRLHDLGKLLTAGPLGDNGVIRGMVVLTTRNVDTIKEGFLPDPFVQNNYLALEYYPWLADKNKLHEPNTPFKMKEYTLGIVKRGPNWKKSQFKIQANTIEGFGRSLRALSKTGVLAVAGPFQNSDKTLGIMLLRSADQKKLLETIQKDPSIQSGEIVCELHSQWLAEGVLEVHDDSSDNEDKIPTEKDGAY